MAKRDVNCIPPNRRRIGRQRVPWRQKVEHYMRDLAIDIEGWEDRKKWLLKYFDSPNKG